MGRSSITTRSLLTNASASAVDDDMRKMVDDDNRRGVTKEETEMILQANKMEETRETCMVSPKDNGPKDEDDLLKSQLGTTAVE